MLEVKSWRAVYILCIIFYAFFLSWSLVFAQESVYVDGDEKNLPAITHTKYFTERPLFFFKDQLDSDLIEKVDSIILCNSSLDDIIFRLMKWTTLKQGDNEVFIAEQGVYDIFIDREQLAEKKLDSFIIIADKVQFYISNDRVFPEGQFIKITDLFLKKGKNTIKIDIKEKNIVFLLGSRRSYLALKNKLKKKEICHIFEKKDSHFYTFENK